MDSPTSFKKEWILTKEAFDRFLATLDSDREQAGRKYEGVRLRLLKYFQWCGAPAPDIEADETINRVARRLQEGENIYSLNAYILGVARLVQAESLKKPYRKHEVIDDAYGIPAEVEDENAEDVAARRACLDGCLRHLSAENRTIVIEYYQEEKGKKIAVRKKLAARLGITLNALRIMVHRIRLNLEECVRECMSRST